MFSRIHPFALVDSSFPSKVDSRHAIGPSNFASSVTPTVTKYCPGTTVCVKLALGHILSIRRSSKRSKIFCLYLRNASPPADSLSDVSLLRSTHLEVEPRLLVPPSRQVSLRWLKLPKTTVLTLHTCLRLLRRY